MNIEDRRWGRPECDSSDSFDRVTVDASERRAALCIGVAQHRDGKFANLVNAVESTKAVARAFSHTLFGPATVVADPRTPIDVFEGLQKAVRNARGGTLCLYFAGFVTDRNGDLLLVTGDADATQRTGCVPWSDVEDILRRGEVARTLFILNAERGPGEAPLGAIKLPTLVVSGALRKFDATCGDAELVAYADGLVAALSARAATILGLLEDGVLEAKGLDRALARDPMIGHARLRDAKVAIAIRDLRADLPKEPPKPPPVVEEPPAPVEEAPKLIEEPVAVAPEPPPFVEEPVIAAPPLVVEEEPRVIEQPRVAAPIVAPAPKRSFVPMVLLLLALALLIWFMRR